MSRDSRVRELCDKAVKASDAREVKLVTNELRSVVSESVQHIQEMLEERRAKAQVRMTVEERLAEADKAPTSAIREKDSADGFADWLRLAQRKRSPKKYSE